MLKIRILGVVVAGVFALQCTLLAQSPIDKPLPPGVTRVPVEFSGGHDTDGRDKGRPVVLIAAALGVPPAVFREAFSHVKPAPAGTQPDPEQVRKNKAALMDSLGKYGVTNERLDEVSNYYRYVRSKGELWPTKPAVTDALVKDNKVLGFEVKDGGVGYNSPPTVSIPNMKIAAPIVTMSYGKDLQHNGAVKAIALGKENPGKEN